jgi:hypothetical protein
MKKLIDLVIRSSVIVGVKLSLILSKRMIHLARNPSNGGIPANMALIIIRVHLLILLFIGSFMLFWLALEIK